MAKNYQRCLKFVVLASVLPFIYGCGAGGVSSLVGFLFGSGLGSIGDIALLGSSGGGAAGVAAGAATLINPEPASMLLLGGGLATMTYFKAKVNQRKK